MVNILGSLNPGYIGTVHSDRIHGASNQHIRTIHQHCELPFLCTVPHLRPPLLPQYTYFQQANSCRFFIIGGFGLLPLLLL